MRIFVKAKPGARERQVVCIDESHFEVSVQEPPVQGRANRAIIHALADYLNVSPAQVEIISGNTSRNKVVLIK